MRVFHNDSDLNEQQVPALFCCDVPDGYIIACSVCESEQLERGNASETRPITTCSGCGYELVYMSYCEW